MPATKNLGYSQFKEKIESIVSTLDNLNITDNQALYNLLFQETSIITVANPDTLDFYNEDGKQLQPKDIEQNARDWIDGLRNVAELFKTVERKYGKKIAEIYYESLRGTPFNEFLRKNGA